MEQDLKLRMIKDRLNDVYHDHKEDIITVFLALQKQNFVLANSLINLVSQWPKDHPTINEELTMFGILLETKD